MNQRQRILFQALQLAGLGAVLIGFGWLEKLQAISVLGIFIFLFGLARFFMLKKLTEKK